MNTYRNFFPIAAGTFWLISSQIACNLNFKLVFFIQPFLHIAIFSHLMIVPPFLSTFRSA